MEPSQNKLAKPLTFIGILVVIAGIVGFSNMGKKATEAAPVTSTSTDTSSVDTTGTVDATSTDTTQASKYKDGTYTSEGNYISPGGAETVGVTLTLKNDVVVASDFKVEAQRPISVQMQNQFAAGYKQYVVGKNIDDVNVGKVSGSSLTPQGFNDAVAKIKVEAKA